MKIIRKYAEFVGYTIYHGEWFEEWRCPNKKCEISVAEDYVFLCRNIGIFIPW